MGKRIQVIRKRNTIYVGRQCLGKKIRFQYGAWWHMAVVKAYQGIPKRCETVHIKTIHLVNIYIPV